MDIEEELNRLDLHLTEIESVLSLSEPVRLRFDFLMQDNCEVDALTPKSVAGVTYQTAIEMKVLAE